jgi:hypothetical protein
MAFRPGVTPADSAETRATDLAVRPMVRIVAAIRFAAAKFYADGCPTLAAAISFYALLSLIPVLFLVIAVAGYVIGSSQDTYQAVLQWVREFIPHLSDDFTRNLEWVVQNRGRLSWLGSELDHLPRASSSGATEFARSRFAIDPARASGAPPPLASASCSGWGWCCCSRSTSGCCCTRSAPIPTSPRSATTS